jgi:uncharacterized protein (TIGR02597 family)
MNPIPKFRYNRLIALCATLGLTCLASAQTTVTTTPVGAITVTIGAGTGTVRQATIASFPLINSMVTTGKTRGAITSLTSTTITSTGAGWTASDLAQPTLPYLLKITSGAATGRIFTISANTADKITLSNSEGVSSTTIDLVALGVIINDTFQIENADTLLSVFGDGTTTGVNISGGATPLGNPNPSLADTIQLVTSNSFQTYYYDTAQSAWINLASEAPSNNVIIRSDTAVIYNRLKNTPLSITLMGDVPSISRKAVVRSGQTTLLSNYWPTDSTLGGLGLHQLAGWVSSNNPSIADLVQMRVGTSWQTFYHDGSSWINLASEANSNTNRVAAGSGLIIKKRATSGNALVLSQAIPYTL